MTHHIVLNPDESALNIILDPVFDFGESQESFSAGKYLGKVLMGPKCF